MDEEIDLSLERMKYRQMPFIDKVFTNIDLVLFIFPMLHFNVEKYSDEIIKNEEKILAKIAKDSRPFKYLDLTIGEDEKGPYFYLPIFSN